MSDNTEDFLADHSGEFAPTLREAALRADMERWRRAAQETALQSIADLGQAQEALDRAIAAEAERDRLRGLLDEARAAMKIVHQDCIGRMPMSRDGKTVPIGASAWLRLCAALERIGE
jgi:hypothetical protein